MDTVGEEEEGAKGRDGIEMSGLGSTSLFIEQRDFSKSEQCSNSIPSELVEERTAAEGTAFHIWVLY